MAENKTQPTKASVKKFISSVANPRRRTDAETALRMYQEITGLPAVMWGPAIVGFGELAYQYESGQTGRMPAAGFSPRKANMTFYVGDGFEGAADLYQKLGKHKKSVACLYINKLDDVDLDVLREIIKADFQSSASKS